MMKKMLSWLLTGSLVLAMSLPVWAEAETEVPQQENPIMVLLGSLLAEDGPIAGMLEEDSPIAGLLAEDGPVAELLAEDGPVAGLLAEDGPIAELFAEDGPVAGLLAEDGPLASLFEEGGALSSYLPEGMNVQDLLKELTDEGSELYQKAGQFIEDMKDENGEIDMEKVTELGKQIGSLLIDTESLEIETEGFEELEIDDAYQDYELIEAAALAYMDEQYGQYFDKGDASNCVTSFLDLKTMEDGSVKAFGYFFLDYFKLEDKEYHLTGGMGQYELMTLVKGEDGSYTVTEEKFPEDGEGNADSLNRMIEEFGGEAEQLQFLSLLHGAIYMRGLAGFLEEHPEAEKIEYMSEMKTAEELNEMADEELNNVIFGSEVEETAQEAVQAVEDTVEEAVEEAEEAVEEAAQAIEEDAAQAVEAVEEFVEEAVEEQTEI